MTLRAPALTVAAGASAAPQAYVTAGNGTPVLMLHSSLASKSQWAGLTGRLCARYRTSAVDLCGYGDEVLPANREAFALDDEVRRVVALLDRLTPPQVPLHVVGHSYGGVVAMRLAELYRTRVASL